MTKKLDPAPYDWHPADKYLPPENEVVIVHQLWPGWAKRVLGSWIALDDCGNQRNLKWEPKYWRREYRPALPQL